MSCINALVYAPDLGRNRCAPCVMSATDAEPDRDKSIPGWHGIQRPLNIVAGEPH